MATRKQKAEPVITGHGHTHDGRRCWAVQSQSEANRWHIVIYTPERLICDCKSGQYRPQTPCAHRRAVHDRLETERANREAAEAEAAAAVMDLFVPTSRDTAILMPANGNKPFSIFKQ
jgi:hypothetical protein